jgi:hypothetical protein
MGCLQVSLWFGLCGALVAAQPGCEDKVTLSFEILVPAQDDPFDGVTEVTLKAGEQETQTTLTSAQDALSLKLKMELGTQTQILLSGRDSGGQLLCSGRSPYFYAVGSKQPLKLWVSRVGRLSLHPAVMETAAGQPAVANYTQQDFDDVSDDLLYTFWFGGCDASGLPIDTAGYFDPYMHEMITLSALGESASWIDPLRPAVARCGSATMHIESGVFLVFGGTDAQGRATDEMDLALPTGAEYGYLPLHFECDDSIDNDGDGQTDTDDTDCRSATDATEDPQRSWARSHGRATALGPYVGLYADDGGQVIDSYLVSGGWDDRGVRAATALHVVSTRTSDGYGYRVDVEEVALAAGRAAHTATLSTTVDGDLEKRTVLLFGGTLDASGIPVAETLSFTLDTSESDFTVNWQSQAYTTDRDATPLPRLTGHAAVALADGTILVVGGRHPDGTLTADAWHFDPLEEAIEHLPDFLSEPRAGHTMTRSETHVLVAGGETAGGQLATDALCIESDTLNGRLEEIARTPMAVPRWGHAAFVLANGQIAVLGGFGTDGTPVADLEIYNPDASL